MQEKKNIMQRQAQNHLHIIQDNVPDDSGYLEVRSFSEKGKGSGQKFIPVGATTEELNTVIDWAMQQSAKGHGIFVGLNPRSEMKGNKEAITQYVAAYLDLDLEKRGITREVAFEEIEHISPIPPTLITDSGRGLHLVWFFEPTTDYEKWKALQESLYEKFNHLGADRAVVSDSARVLRLTPFPNQKEDVPIETKIVKFTPREELRSFEITSELFDVDFTKKQRTSFRLPIEIPEGGNVEGDGRNILMFKEASALRNRGYSEEEIYAAISELNARRCVPPMKDTEVSSIAESVMRYEPTRSMVSEITPQHSGLAWNLEDFLNAEFPPLDWVIYGLNHGELGMMQAKPSVGKTTMMLNVALSAAAGKEFRPLLEAGKPRKVIYLDFENREAFMQEDLRKMLDNFTLGEQALIKQNFKPIVDEEIDEYPLNLSNPRHLQAVMDAAIAHDAELIIIDTLAAAYTLNNENDNAEVERVILQPAKKLLKATNAAVVLVHHIGKSGENFQRDKLYRGRGASSLPAFCRLILDLDHSRDSQRKPIKNNVVLNCAKIKGKPFDDVNFELDFEARWFNPIDNAIEDEPTRLEKIVDLVNKPMSKDQIERAVVEIGINISERTLFRELSDAVDNGLIEKCKTGIYAPAGWSDEKPCDILDAEYLTD